VFPNFPTVTTILFPPCCYVYKLGLMAGDIGTIFHIGICLSLIRTFVTRKMWWRFQEGFIFMENRLTTVAVVEFPWSLDMHCSPACCDNLVFITLP